jgi:hypothetical protein
MPGHGFAPHIVDELRRFMLSIDYEYSYSINSGRLPIGTRHIVELKIRQKDAAGSALSDCPSLHA